uniref:Uncharacterized protein n=1 Tax=Wuchereria bancrofti TaxID=6293 RepID=A0AAF5Q4G3_WUCBA
MLADAAADPNRMNCTASSSITIISTDELQIAGKINPETESWSKREERAAGRHYQQQEFEEAQLSTIMSMIDFSDHIIDLCYGNDIDASVDGGRIWSREYHCVIGELPHAAAVALNPVDSTMAVSVEKPMVKLKFGEVKNFSIIMEIVSFV